MDYMTLKEAAEGEWGVTPRRSKLLLHNET